MHKRNLLKAMQQQELEELLRLATNAATLAREWQPELVALYTRLAAECMFELWQRGGQHGARRGVIAAKLN